MELASVLLFQSRGDDAIRRTAGLSPASQADQIGKAVSAATIDSRQLARAGGINRLVVEADALGIDLTPEKLPLETARDFTRARMVGQSYSERWYRNVVNATPAEAKAATQGSLARIAVTENSEAFSSGRSKYLQSKPDLGLLRVWDATLDKLTCPICAGADGTIVGAHEPFPYGEPGSVHPYDRCCWTLLRSTETGGETLIEPRTPTLVQVPGAVSPFAPKWAAGAGKQAVSPRVKPVPRVRKNP